MTKPAPSPPAHLSERSKALWEAIAGRRVRSPERLTLFQTALETLDRADELRTAVDREGITTVTATTKATHIHPALKAETQARALFAKIWSQLDLGWCASMDGGKYGSTDDNYKGEF